MAQAAGEVGGEAAAADVLGTESARVLGVVGKSTRLANQEAIKQPEEEYNRPVGLASRTSWHLGLAFLVFCIFDNSRRILLCSAYV
jgi:hypothetical protein